MSIMKWLGLAALLGCNSGKKIVHQGSLASGPFEICWEVTESRSGAWYNNGGDYNAKQYTSWFSIKYQGKTVQVPAFDRYWGSAQAGQHPEKPVEYFWQAFFLKDAPHPAILTGIHSLHLITEENGQLKITPLHEQDNGFATYQWLDSENGQPGAMNNVTLGDDSGGSRYLSGGRYLMLNSKVILDVQTLEVFKFDTHTYGESQKDLDDYNATNSFIVQVSPGKTQMALMASRFNPIDRMLPQQYALVAIDFKKNRGYAVPFDRTDTRFFSIWDATQTWFDTFFEWKKNEAGEERLALRKLQQLPYWQGRWSYSDSGEVDRYQLMPVKDSMLPVFLEFIRQEVAVKQEQTEKTPHYEVGSPDTPSCYLVNTTLQVGDDDLTVYLSPMDQSISLRSANQVLVKKIGQHFDEAMKKGEFQEYFGRYE